MVLTSSSSTKSGYGDRDLRLGSRPASDKRLQIQPEELLQSLGPLSGEAFNYCADAEAAFTFLDPGGSKEAPETGKMLECMAIDALLGSLYPAFIGDIDILYWPVEH